MVHLILVDEVSHSLEKMKFCCNQSYLFKNKGQAFIIAFAQFIVIIFTEILNVLIIVITNTPLEVVMNFVAIIIISQIDDYVYASI